MLLVSIPNRELVGFQRFLREQYPVLISVSIPNRELVGFQPGIDKFYIENASEVSIPNRELVGFQR